ncbi:uncharacterized protein [Narcine bancroftii]
MNLVDKLREKNLVPYQGPISSCAKPEVNQHMLPLDDLARETCFIGEDQESLKHPQDQISWHNHPNLKHAYSAVNNESQGVQQADLEFQEKRGGVQDDTKISTRSKLWNDDSHGDCAHGNQSRKGLKILSFSGPPSALEKHWKRCSFNPFFSANQYHVLDAVADPLEVRDYSNHGNKAVPLEVKEPYQSNLPIGSADLLGQAKWD